ncbi:MAG: type II toxin-antitoxin system VapC family toxin [Thermosphaera sp.]|nr:type II toxin-antitoxin system VapC family toxin [Thermosphaera sp.]
MKLLDTSIVIEQLKTGMYRHGAISFITLIEILRGVPVEKREAVKKHLEKSYTIIHLNNEIILEYCEIYDKLRKTGEILNDADLLIAATAIASNLTLVSRDKDFERLLKHGLKLESSL